MINLAPRRLAATGGQEEGGGVPSLVFDAVEVVGDCGNRGCDDGLRQFISIEFTVVGAEKNRKGIS